MYQQTIDGLREFAQNGGGHYFLTPAEVGDVIALIDNVSAFATQLARRDTPDRELKQAFDSSYCEERLRIIRENKRGQRVISVTQLVEEANPIIRA